MSRKEKTARLLSRILANAIAVAAVTAIFGLKTSIDAHTRAANPPDAEGGLAIAHYEPYLTEQP